MTTNRFALAMLLVAAPTVAHAQMPALDRLIRNLGDADYSGVEAVATGIAQDGTGLFHRSREEEGPFTFEADFIPAADTSKLAAFSDDGVTVLINRFDENGELPMGYTVTNVANHGAGQALPRLGQSLKPIHYEFEAGRKYRIYVEYSNTVYQGASDIDGVLLFAYAGGGSAGTHSPLPINLTVKYSPHLPVGVTATIEASHPDVGVVAYEWFGRCGGGNWNKAVGQDTATVENCGENARTSDYKLELTHLFGEYDNPARAETQVTWHAPNEWDMSAGDWLRVLSDGNTFTNLWITPVTTTLRWNGSDIGDCAHVNAGEHVTFTAVNSQYQFMENITKPQWTNSWKEPVAAYSIDGFAGLYAPHSWVWDSPALLDLTSHMQKIGSGVSFSSIPAGETLYIVHREYLFVGTGCDGVDWKLRTGVVDWAARVGVDPETGGKMVRFVRINNVVAQGES